MEARATPISSWLRPFRGPVPVSLLPTYVPFRHQQHIQNSVSNQYSLNKQCSASNFIVAQKYVKYFGLCR